MTKHEYLEFLAILRLSAIPHHGLWGRLFEATREVKWREEGRPWR